MTRIRFAIDLSTRDQFVDVLTGAAPIIWRAADLEFQIGLFDNGAVANVADIDQIVLEVKTEADPNSPARLRLTAAYEDINRDLDADAWAEGDAHATLAATAAQTALDLGNKETREFRLIVSALTTDEPARTVILGTSRLTIQESGAGGPDETPTPPDSYYTKVEADARFVAASELADVAADLAALQIIVTGQGTTITSHTATLAAHAITLAGHSAALGPLAGTVSTHTSQISTLQSTVATHNSDLVNLDARIDDLEAAASGAVGFDGPVKALMVVGDSIYAAGAFTEYGETALHGVAKLSVQGVLDPTFRAVSNHGGSFTGWSPTGLSICGDGDILVTAGGFVGKLNPSTGAGHSFGAGNPLGVAAPLDRTFTFAVGLNDDNFAVAEHHTGGGGVDLIIAPSDSGDLLADEEFTGMVGGLASVKRADGYWRLFMAGTAYTAAATLATYAGGEDAPAGLRLLYVPDPFLSLGDQEDDDFQAGAGTGSKATCGRTIVGYDFADGPYAIAGNVLGDDDVDHSWNGGSTTAFRGLLKVWMDGTADGTFAVNLVLTASQGAAIPFAIDGKQRLYFGGPVESINGTAVTPWRLYRLTKDGALDAVFDDFDDDVLCCALRDDNTVIVGGEFTSYDGHPALRIATIDAAGRVVVPTSYGDLSGIIWSYAAKPDPRNVPSLKLGLLRLTNSPPEMYVWDDLEETWVAI